MGTIVETNCVFSNDQLCPVTATPLLSGAATLVNWNASNIDTCYEGIKQRDLGKIFQSFVQQPLCTSLDLETAKELFTRMCRNTRAYLDPYYDLDAYFAK